MLLYEQFTNNTNQLKYIYDTLRKLYISSDSMSPRILGGELTVLPYKASDFKFKLFDITYFLVKHENEYAISDTTPNNMEYLNLIDWPVEFINTLSSEDKNLISSVKTINKFNL